ncbi:AlpA family transcriptional regulator [Tropicibacter sp. Alg240-R139]|uniref:helix-turn-helix transcriptional regulator n=1 Tax=Tropicibacter sp. Alg240-R139 TaxID=2305991 RepID=UPI0013E0BF7A|nr:helix-turn-helix domain-containing protein [Tropicibacter sp. Alg240-R139]
MNTHDHLSYNDRLPSHQPTQLPNNIDPDAPWPGFMRLKTLAEYLDMSPNTLIGLVEQGLLPRPVFCPRSRVKRWSKTEIDSAMFGQETQRTVGRSMADVMAEIATKRVN